MDDGLSSGHTQFGIDVSAVDEVGMLQGGGGGFDLLILIPFHLIRKWTVLGETIVELQRHFCTLLAVANQQLRHQRQVSAFLTGQLLFEAFFIIGLNFIYFACLLSII